MNKHTKSTNAKSFDSQRGVVIVVALVTLLVMTMVGLTAIGNATLQEKMAANNRFYFQARLNAETALREAEDFLSGRVDANIAFNEAQDVIDLFNTDPQDHLYLNTQVIDSGIEVSLQTPSIDSNLADKSNWTVGTGSLAVPILSAQDSRYIVEYIGTIDYRAISGIERVDISNVGNKQPPSREPWAFRITAIGYSSNPNIYSVLESIYATQTR